MSIASEITRLTNLRNTIRSKLVSLGLVSSSADLDTCADAISGITNRGNVSHTISSRDAVYTIPDGYHAGAGSVTISNTERQKIIASNIRSGVTILGIAGSYEGGGTVVEPDLQNKTVTPTKSTQYITPDSGYDGLYQVIVNPIPAQYITTTDATAVASEILNGKTAYVNGSRIVGTMTRRSSVTDAQSVGLNGGSLAIRIPTGAYLQTASSGYPEIIVNAGTANANQVLQGVTFLSNTGSGLQTGEMINRGAWTSTVEPGNRVTIPAGWHNGSGYVEANEAEQTGDVLVHGTITAESSGYLMNYIINVAIDNPNQVFYMLLTTYSDINLSSIISTLFSVSFNGTKQIVRLASSVFNQKVGTLGIDEPVDIPRNTPVLAKYDPNSNLDDTYPVLYM